MAITFRDSKKDRERLEWLMKYFDLKTLSAAIRKSIEKLYEKLKESEEWKK